MVKDRHRRIQLLLALFMVVAILGLGRLGFLQLIAGAHLSRQAWSARADFVALEDFSRGEIVDRYGRSLTDTTYEPGLIVFPVLMSEPERVAGKLAAILKMPFPELISKLQKNKPAVILKKDLTPTEIEQIHQLGENGLCILPVKKRYGPAALAEHLVGYVAPMAPGVWEEMTITRSKTPLVWNWGGVLGWSEEHGYGRQDLIGVKGMERIYEEDLHFSSDAEGVLVLKDAANRPLNPTEIRLRNLVSAPEFFNRRKVVLTIDRDIQAVVEGVMDQRIPRGAVVVMDIATREVLAMASRPGFDQNKVAAYLDESTAVGVFRNRALDYYYPGSVFKIVVMAAALNEGLVDSKETFFCPGAFTVAENLTIPCWKKEGHGHLTLTEAFAQSCNPVFLEIGQRLGAPLLLKYAQYFGLTQAQLLGYPLSLGPALQIPNYPGAVANASLGQKGVKITPLMVASLMATLAGSGEYRMPQIVKRIQDQSNQIIREIAPGVAHRAVAPSTARELCGLLSEVTKTGTGKEAWVVKEGSAGKTGSAQSGQQDVSGEEIIDAWFAGYAPLSYPRYAVAVLVEGGESGGSSAAPVFREIIEKVLALKGENEGNK
ncbi:MAG: hypothetical protein GX295_09510 [Syntrophomonadaceae bacterium]|nr:hypothetical protein [Syntrophomonadaceae bacterium]